MTDPAAHGGPAPTRASSGCAPWALGCTLGCGGLVLLSFLAVALAGWWFVRPGDQHSTAAAVGPESLGAFRVADLGDDEGARAALEALVRETSRISPPPADAERPFWIRSDDPEAMAGLFSRLLPREGTLAFEPAPGREELVPVLVLNLRGMTRPLRMILESDDSRPRYHRDVAIVTERGGDAVFAMIDGTLVVSEDEGAVRSVIDRVRDGTAVPLATSFEVLEPPSDHALLSGATTFEPGTLAESLRREAKPGEPPPIDPALLEGVDRFEIVVDRVDPRAVGLRIGLGTRSPREAAIAARAVGDLLRDEMAPASVRTRTGETGSHAIVEAEITGWIEPFAAWIARSEDERDTGRSGSPGALPAERLPRP